MILSVGTLITTILYFQDITAVSNLNTTTLSSPIIPSGCKSSDDLPDPKCTPGALNGNVTQDNIENTICHSGFAKSIRPPTSYTTPLEKKLIKSYGFTGGSEDFELDHLISLQLGGSPKDIKNLWPEPYFTKFNAYIKDKFENYLHKQICNGAMSLSEAQKQIATDWKTNWKEAQKH
jgi:hypothetical protein